MYFLRRDHYLAHAGAAVGRKCRRRIRKAKLVQYDPAIADRRRAHRVFSIRSPKPDCRRLRSMRIFSPALASLIPQAGARICGAAQNPEKLNRLYSIESTPTTTGFKAEASVGLRASEFQPSLPGVRPKPLSYRVEAPSMPGPTSREVPCRRDKDLKVHAARALYPRALSGSYVLKHALAINIVLRNFKGVSFGVGPEDLPVRRQSGRPA